MSLHGLEILVVEDEPLIAMDISQTLEAAGATVHGPLRSVSDVAARVADRAVSTRLHCVILDYRLVDGTSEVIADQLARARIPFVLHTGNSELVQSLAERYGAQVVGKPSSDTALLAAVRVVTRS